jgi:hypothetical protein
MAKGKLARHYRRKETIKCECGVEINIVRNGKVMGDAIKDHVVVHMQKITGLDATSEAERVEDALIAQVFKIAIQSED